MAYPLPKSYDAAAKILDKEMPDWYKKIDISKLDMTIWDSCIFGQLYGDYKIGYTKLLGKSSMYFDGNASKEEWIKQIEMRLNQENSNYSLKYVHKSARLLAQAELHKLRAEEHIKKAKAENALAKSLLKAAKLAYG